MTFAELCRQAHELSVALDGRRVSVSLVQDSDRKFMADDVTSQFKIEVYVAKGAPYCEGGVCEDVPTISQASALLHAVYPTTPDESVEIGEIAEQIA